MGRTLTGFADAIQQSHARALAALLVLALACFLPGFFSLPPIDRDEGRYVQTSKQMIETGEYVDIWFHDDPRYKQPAGIYWLQVGAAKLSGLAAEAPVWVYRLPSLAGALLVVLLTYWIGQMMGGRGVGLIAGAAMAGCILLGVEARLAKTDAMLNAMILVAQGVLAKLYLSYSRDPRAGIPMRSELPLGYALLFWVACGVGIMIKGPILVLFVGLTAAALSVVERGVGWLAPLRPQIGVPLLLAIVMPWMVAIGVITDGAFYAKAVGWNVMGKMVEGHQSHGAPPGLYLVLFWFTFWPAATLLAVSLPWIWRERPDRRVRFLLCWIVPAWIVYELVVTKLPHYVLPLYPAIAILSALAVAGGASALASRWGRALLVVGITGLFIVPFGALVLLYVFEQTVSLPGILFALMAAAGAVIALTLVRDQRPLAAWGVMVVAMVPLYLTAYQAVGPRLETIWIAPRVAAAVDAATDCPSREVMATDFEEASLIFLVGTDIRFGTPSDAASFLAAAPCRVAIVDRTQDADFKAAVAADGGSADETARIDGLNIGNGRQVSLGIYRAGAP